MGGERHVVVTVQPLTQAAAVIGRWAIDRAEAGAPLVSAIAAPASSPRSQAAGRRGRDRLRISQTLNTNASRVRHEVGGTRDLLPGCRRRFIPAWPGIQDRLRVIVQLRPTEVGAVLQLRGRFRGSTRPLLCRQEECASVARAGVTSPEQAAGERLVQARAKHLAIRGQRNVFAGSPALTAWTHGLAAKRRPRPGNLVLTGIEHVAEV